jgi:hypothetical protein
MRLRTCRRICRDRPQQGLKGLRENHAFLKKCLPITHANPSPPNPNPWTGAPCSPKRTWAMKIFFECFYSTRKEPWMGFAPSFSAHVRLGEHGAPVQGLGFGGDGFAWVSENRSMLASHEALLSRLTDVNQRLLFAALRTLADTLQHRAVF